MQGVLKVGVWGACRRSRSIPEGCKAACTHPKKLIWPPLGGESGFEMTRLSDFEKALVRHAATALNPRTGRVQLWKIGDDWKAGEMYKEPEFSDGHYFNAGLQPSSFGVGAGSGQARTCHPMQAPVEALFRQPLNGWFPTFEYMEIEAVIAADVFKETEVFFMGWIHHLGNLEL